MTDPKDSPERGPSLAAPTFLPQNEHDCWPPYEFGRAPSAVGPDTDASVAAPGSLPHDDHDCWPPYEFEGVASAVGLESGGCVAAPVPLPEDDHNYWPPYEFGNASSAAGLDRGPAAAREAKPSTAASASPKALPPSAGNAMASAPAWVGPATKAPAKGVEAHAPLPPARAEPFGAAEAEVLEGFPVGAALPVLAPARARRAYGRKATGAAAPIEHLPLASDQDMFPAFMSRSALFGAARPNAGGLHVGPLEAAGNVALSFDGPSLSMLDKRVWEALVRFAKASRLDVHSPFKVPMSRIAKEAGLAQSGSRAVWASMARLACSRLDAVVDGVAIKGLLLAEARRKGRGCEASFDPDLLVPALSQVLQASMASAASPPGASPLRQWLRDYFSTHEALGRPFTLDYLRKLSGYGSQTKRFPADLENAMASLKLLDPGLIAEWSIKRDGGVGDAWMLSVVRGKSRPCVKQPAKTAAAAEPRAARSQVAVARKRRRGPEL